MRKNVIYVKDGTLKSTLRLITYFVEWLLYINLATLKLFNGKKGHFVSSALSIEFWTEKRQVLLEKKINYVKKVDFENRICQFPHFTTKSVPD